MMRGLIDVALDRRLALLGLTGFALPAWAQRAAPPLHDIKRYGALGDGRTIDSAAINRAIRAANAAGGGTVIVPAGRYLCFSIRLLDHVTLYLSSGAVIEAADPAVHGARYDVPENDLDEQFQDFGITHVHNSLVYADGATNIAILGPGMFHGLGLDREGPGDRWHARAGWQSAASLGLTPREVRLRDPRERAQDGRSNKTIGMRNCRNVLLRDFTVLQGGHFCVIVHGLTNLAIDNLTIDTDRDGIDVDCSRDVRITNCVVNAPKDDAIVLKSSYALDRKVACEDVTITGCKTSGYRLGTFLDGSYQPSDYVGPDKIGPLGRIKLGTESNGGFRNIQISDCTCTNTRGILIGVVDGGTLEDVRISGIVLRDPVNHPLFVHQAARLRAPAGTPVGRCRRVRFSDVTVSGADPRYPCGVAGIADAPVEDISFDGVHVQHRGGGTAADAKLIPPDRRETSLEVSFMGTLPGFGFFGRHARQLTLRDMTFTTDTPDARPAIALEDVRGAIVDGVASQRDRSDLVASRDSSGIAIGRVERIA